MQIQKSPTYTAIEESVNKNSILLEQKKYYEFAQKIETLTHRKQQSQKLFEAELLLTFGIKKLLEVQPQTEVQNIVQDLFNKLFALFQKNQVLWNKDSKNRVCQLLNRRWSNDERKYSYYVRILKSIAKFKEVPEIGEDLISYYERSEQFVKAESHIIEADLSRVCQFLSKWEKKVDKDEIISIQCRVALLRGLFSNFDDAMILISEIPTHNPYCKFAKFLIQTVQMKSRECFEKIGQSYKLFLEKDSVYDKIYQSYGLFFFKKEKEEAKGLGSLLKMFE